MHVVLKILPKKGGPTRHCEERGELSLIPRGSGSETGIQRTAFGLMPFVRLDLEKPIF